MRRSSFCIFAVIAMLGFALLGRGQTAPKQAANTAEQKADAYLQSIRQQPSLLLEFLRQMPKGADLHNHLPGAVYAESYIKWAAQDGLCIDRKTLRAIPPEPMPAKEGSSSQDAQGCDTSKGHVPARNALTDPDLYRELLGAWSMRNFSGNGESAHDHFFNTFLKFGAAENNHLGDMLAEAVSRAAHQNVVYLELIVEPTNFEASRLGAGLNWNGDMAAMRQKLLDGRLPRVVADDIGRWKVGQ